VGFPKPLYIRNLNEKVKAQIERKMEQYAKHANNGRKRLMFKPDD